MTLELIDDNDFYDELAKAVASMTSAGQSRTADLVEALLQTALVQDDGTVDLMGIGRLLKNKGRRILLNAALHSIAG